MARQKFTNGRSQRPLSRNEVVADAIVHVVGLIAAIVGAIALIDLSAARGVATVAVIIYSAGLITMLACSLLYNMAPIGPRKNLFKRFDHAGIFLMIAGTYTPLTTQYLSGAWSIAIMSVVWGTAVVGAFIKIVFPHRFDGLVVAVYLAMGWVIVFALDPLLATMSVSTFVLVCIGGALYTVGVAFHLWEQLRFQTAIWHSFVIAAAGVHYAAVMDSVLIG